MVTNRRKHSDKTPVKQGPEGIVPEARTPVLRRRIAALKPRVTEK